MKFIRFFLTFCNYTSNRHSNTSITSNPNACIFLFFSNSKTHVMSFILQYRSQKCNENLIRLMYSTIQFILNTRFRIHTVLILREKIIKVSKKFSLNLFQKTVYCTLYIYSYSSSCINALLQYIDQQKKKIG